MIWEFLQGVSVKRLRGWRSPRRTPYKPALNQSEKLAKANRAQHSAAMHNPETAPFLGTRAGSATSRSPKPGNVFPTTGCNRC